MIEHVEPTRPSYFKVLCYGEPGTGKTHFISTWPDPILVLVTDPDGDATLRPLVASTGKRIDKIDFTTMPTLKRYREAHRVINDIIADKPDYQLYKTIVLDSATGLMDILMAEALRSMCFPGSSKLVPKGSMDEPTMNHYSGEGAKAGEFYRGLATIKRNLLLNFHTRQDTDKEGTVLAIYPFVRGPNRAAGVTRLFNEVYHITTRRVADPNGGMKNEHVLELTPTGKHITCKSSLPNVPKTVPADMEALIAIAYPNNTNK